MDDPYHEERRASREARMFGDARIGYTTRPATPDGDGMSWGLRVRLADGTIIPCNCPTCGHQLAKDATCRYGC